MDFTLLGMVVLWYGSSVVCTNTAKELKMQGWSSGSLTVAASDQPAQELKKKKEHTLQAVNKFRQASQNTSLHEQYTLHGHRHRNHQHV